MAEQKGIPRVIKTLFDRSAAAFLFILLSPLMIAIAGLIRLFMGKPVLFCQLRPGYKGRLFQLTKFRTMNEVRDQPDDLRLTPLGTFLRRTSLDELPQLINVLRGELSFVGPRPLLIQYLDRYSLEQARRHDVLPGMTGWAQINGRNAISWEEKFKLDIWYVDHWSLALDFRILWRTVFSVLSRSGISHPGQATMPEFQGSSDKRE